MLNTTKIIQVTHPHGGIEYFQGKNQHEMIWLTDKKKYAELFNFEDTLTKNIEFLKSKLQKDTIVESIEAYPHKMIKYSDGKQN